MSQPSSSSAAHRGPWWATIGLAVVFAAASLAGLIWAEALYPGLDAQLAFIPLDLYDLLVITPPVIVLLVALREGRSMGLACWAGYTLYTLYHGVTHLWAMPLGPAMAPWAVVVVASACITASIPLTVDRDRLRRRLGRRLYARLGGGVLLVLAGAFGVYALVEMIRGSLAPANVTQLDSMLWLADLSVAPVCVIAGLALWRRQPLGFCLGPGALVLFAALFLGLPAVEGFRALTTTAMLDLGAVLTGLVGGIASVLALALSPRQEPPQAPSPGKQA